MIFFVAKSEVCKFVDDTTLCSCGKHLLRIKQDLIYDKEILLKQFETDSLKSKPEVFQFMALGEKTCCKHISKKYKIY